MATHQLSPNPCLYPHSSGCSSPLPMSCCPHTTSVASPRGSCTLAWVDSSAPIRLVSNPPPLSPPSSCHSSSGSRSSTGLLPYPHSRIICLPMVSTESVLVPGTIRLFTWTTSFATTLTTTAPGPTLASVSCPKTRPCAIPSGSRSVARPCC